MLNLRERRRPDAYLAENPSCCEGSRHVFRRAKSLGDVDHLK
jgi:hypothetical protein